MRKIVPNATDKLLSEIGIFLEVNALLIGNLTLLRRCFYSFALEFLAD